MRFSTVYKTGLVAISFQQTCQREKIALRLAALDNTQLRRRRETGNDGFNSPGRSDTCGVKTLKRYPLTCQFVQFRRQVFAPEAPDVISTQALQEDDDQV